MKKKGQTFSLYFPFKIFILTIFYLLQKWTFDGAFSKFFHIQPNSKAFEIFGYCCRFIIIRLFFIYLKKMFKIPLECCRSIRVYSDINIRHIWLLFRKLNLWGTSVTFELPTQNNNIWPYCTKEDIMVEIINACCTFSFVVNHLSSLTLFFLSHVTVRRVSSFFTWLVMVTDFEMWVIYKLIITLVSNFLTFLRY